MDTAMANSMNWELELQRPLHVPEIDGQPVGGQASFTRSGLMVAPRKGDLLLFAYKNVNNTFDNGFAEHSACKEILGGRKWIAVQWYREGLDYEHPFKGH
jgi:hypothetical protein